MGTTVHMQQPAIEFLLVRKLDPAVHTCTVRRVCDELFLENVKTAVIFFSAVGIIRFLQYT